MQAFISGMLVFILISIRKDTISELVQEGSNITIDTINSFTVLHSSGLNILPAPKSPESAEYITEEHIEKLLSIMRPYYDVIIIDLPVVHNNTTLAAIENSDTVLYVATPDIASLKDVFQVQKVMQSLQQHDKFKLLLNRFGSGDIVAKGYQKQLRLSDYRDASRRWKDGVCKYQ